MLSSRGRYFTLTRFNKTPAYDISKSKMAVVMCLAIQQVITGSFRRSEAATLQDSVVPLAALGPLMLVIHPYRREGRKHYSSCLKEIDEQVRQLHNLGI